MNMRSGSDRSEKYRSYQRVDEFMTHGAHVVSHAHASAMNPDGRKAANGLVLNNTDHKSGENTSKSPEPKRKDEIFLRRCLGRIEDNSNKLLDNLKPNDDMKMSLLISMQQTMAKLAEKL